MATLSMIEWSKINLEEMKERWAKRRIQLEEEAEKKRVEEEKKKEREWKREEIWKKKKDKKRKRAIRERRCFVCGIFGHIAHYCRNRGKDKELVQVLWNRFEVLRNRVMQKGEGSGRSMMKDRKKILKEERVKKIKVEKREKKKINKKTKKIEGKDKKKEKREGNK